MSNFNAHETSRCNASQAEHLDLDEQQQAIAKLPTSYPFELTLGFQDAFDSDQKALALPSSYKFAYWKLHVGDPHWQEAQKAAQEHNRKLEQEDHVRRTCVLKKNRLEQERYEQALAEYEELLARYEQACVDHKEAVAGEPNRMVNFVKQKTMDRLTRDLASQEVQIRAAVEQVYSMVMYSCQTPVDVRCTRALLILAIICLPTPLFVVSSICCFLAWWARRGLLNSCRRILPEALTFYNGSFCGEALERWWQAAGMTPTYRFFCDGRKPEDEFEISTQVGFVTKNRYGHLKWPTSLEKWPLGRHLADDWSEPEKWRDYYPPRMGGLISLVPLLGLLWNWRVWRSKQVPEYAHALWEANVSIDQILEERRNRLGEVLKEELERPEVIAALIEENRQHYKTFEEPIPPQKPLEPKFEPLPPEPVPMVPKPLEPPRECLDTTDKGLIEHVFKGSQVYGISQVTALAKSQLFANDRVHPHFTFGGVPFRITGNAPHMLVVGTTGSGKTTTLLRLMSSLLPLATCQLKAIAEGLAKGEAAYPASLHQWARSRTHQAVVYNAKGEYVQYLEAFGFDKEVDLFNLDPADPNGYAWDVAADIDTREGIEKFAEQLIPKNLAASQDQQAEFWNSAARGVVKAIIISLRNAAIRAGEQPSWTLRDLVKIGRNSDYIKHVLKWHDTPLEVLKEFFELAAQQESSVMLTLRQCMRDYESAAQRWYHAKQNGRSVSLKKWALEGGQSVLVLPDTMANISSNGPLNKALIKALAGIWLDDKYAFYCDEAGNWQKRHRFLIIDEFGEAGNFDELTRLLSQGRTFGIHVLLGLHQLSQVREAYGENKAETIIGLCPYKAFLKSDDVKTQKWISDLIGNCLRSYKKSSFSYSTSDGVTITKSSNESEGASEGTNKSKSNSTTKGASDTTVYSEAFTESKQSSATVPAKPGAPGSATSGTVSSKTESASGSHTENESSTESETFGSSWQKNWSSSTGESNAHSKTENHGISETIEIRGEPAIEPSEFGRFPDPETTGRCEGVYITPTLPVFRSVLQSKHVQPEFTFPQKANRLGFQSKPGENETASRPSEWTNQDLARLFIDKPEALPAPPHMILELSNLPNNVQFTKQDAKPAAKKAEEYEEPLADFEF